MKSLRVYSPYATLDFLGGFSASLVVLAAMGLVLDRAGGFTTEAFRLAWLVQYPVWAVALVCLVRAQRTAR